MLAWLARGGVDVSRIDIERMGDGERTVRARLPIRAGEVVLRIPRRYLITLAEVDAVTPERVGNYLRRFPITGDGFFCSVGPREWPVTN